MKLKVRCNKCDYEYIEQDKPIPECPECGHTSVTFIEWIEERDWSLIKYTHGY